MISETLQKTYRHPLLVQKDLEAVYNAHRKIIFKKGEHVLEAGTISNEYLVIEDGLMRSYVIDYNGNDITTNFFSAGELVIEPSSLFQRVPSEENIMALTDCICWKLEFQVFQELFNSIQGFREWGRAWMANSLFEFKQRSVAMITDSATERYQRLLKDKPLVMQNAPLKYIASYLGITDSSLSRIRKETSKN